MAVSRYFADGFLNYKATVQESVHGLQSRINSFDAIACSGTSGLLIAPALAAEMDKALIIVRKPRDGSHAVEYVEFDESKKLKRFIVVDDVYCSGKTFARIYDKVTKAIPSIECFGYYSYETHEFSNRHIDYWISHWINNKQRYRKLHTVPKYKPE